MIRRRLLQVVFTIVSAACIPAAGEQRDFVGTWQATFKGDVFMTLKITGGPSIAGTLSGGNIRVDESGELTEASGGGEEHPISNVKVDGDRMSFDWKDDDETLKMEFKLTGAGAAELQFLSLPEGVKMKPIRFTRA